jgi:2-polyprenyl-6-methoxyphenol hydroxylase-like FAD-dependent oxidoreductase
MNATDVLIVGAGPTGLVLALWLTRLGVRVRLIDKTDVPGTTSRALVIHARTLELYRQVGVAKLIVERGLPFVAANLWARGRQAAHLVFGDIGAGLTAFPYMMVHPQDEHERMLLECLERLDVRVERQTELVSFSQEGEQVIAELRLPSGASDRCASRYIAGCDGAHSRVREVIGAGFPGGTYSRMFYVADVEAAGPAVNHQLHVALDDADFLAIFPLAGPARARLIGTVLEASVANDRPLRWEDVSAAMLQRMQIDVKQVNWFSTYHVHHRVAGTFRRDRAFLAGDAAHIHSPVGAQGMNTGIGDAVNLGWKLAAAIRGTGTPRMLDTYEPERIAFARRLVATTDRAFSFVTSDGPLARFVRLHVVPHTLPQLFRLPAVRRFMFRTVSQTLIEYRDSALSRGEAGGVKAGDRLPWLPPPVEGELDHDNHAPLAALDWQVHVYGDALPAGLAALCAQRGLAVHTFPWRDAAAKAGFARDAVYLVRPDGYVAFAQPSADPAALQGFLDEWALRPFVKQ